MIGHRLFQPHEHRIAHRICTGGEHQARLTAGSGDRFAVGIKRQVFDLRADLRHIFGQHAVLPGDVKRFLQLVRRVVIVIGAAAGAGFRRVPSAAAESVKNILVAIAGVAAMGAVLQPHARLRRYLVNRFGNQIGQICDAGTDEFDPARTPDRIAGVDDFNERRTVKRSAVPRVEPGDAGVAEAAV